MQKEEKDESLHSNMVRFIIEGYTSPEEILERFTFQYG